jgi:RNA polymerase sigma factor (sigma-70 family)
MNNLFLELYFLVPSRMKKYKKFSQDEDFEQELSAALWVAIKTFDCHKNFDFYRWSGWHLSKAARNFLGQKKVGNSINLYVQSALTEESQGQERVTLLRQILVEKPILSEREKRIIWDYYLEGKTLKEIGKDLVLTPERVRQVRDIGLSKIRRKL